MNIKKKLGMFVVTLMMMLSLLPIVNVQAANRDVKIISDTEVTAKEARNWAKSKGATREFQDLAELYFDYSSECGDVNPAIAYVQSAKETGYGNFGGVIDASYHNPCGLKKAEGGDNYDPNAHERFDSWKKGVQAHLDHLALYAGADGYPKSDTYDPRPFSTIKGRATKVNDLSGNWAPSSTYGEEIVNLYNDLLDYADVEEKSDDDIDEDNSSVSSMPNPGTQENKPGLPNIKDVIKNIKSEVIDKNQDNTTNITSNIGWKNENGIWYYYKSDNTKAKGWIKPDSNWYYLKDDGKMVAGWFDDNGTWYYLKNTGAMARGWIQLNNSWYYLKNSGAMATGFINDGSALYYLKGSGAMTENNGWANLNGKWYYYEASGRVKTGWLKDGYNWYYLQGDGSMVTGLNKIDNKNYLLNDNVSMKTGWAKINNYWYYFNNDGSMATGWIKDNGVYYYLYDTYAMAKGWINLDGAWYYLKDSGAMSTGWVMSNGEWYYLQPSTGRLITNSTIDNYIIGFDGKAKLKDSKNKEKSIDSNINKSKNNKTIAIDAGHDYGRDYGVEIPINGVKYIESDLDIQVAAKLKNELVKKGYNVVMTREYGEKPSYGSLKASLAHRVDIANNANADFFISIHHNAVDGIPNAKGVETYYSTNYKDNEYGGGINFDRVKKSKEIAKIINDSIVNKINATNRGAKSDASAAVGSLFILRNANMPAVLVETGFLTNPEEALRCADSNGQQEVAEAIAEAIYSVIK